ncbi:MAG: hypothetical protein L6R39_005033 [Caloplaca ligustica]|nr:MAG: hypothetical protein L6R39_005033 [Caloplaca ligustica]
MVLYASPPANLEFVALHGTGTMQDASQFVRLCDSEIQYWRDHPPSAGVGPGHLKVSRKFTDVFLGCDIVYGLESAGLWGVGLALNTLRTIRGLIEANGFREYEYDVRRSDGKKWAHCRIWLQNPHGSLPGLAGS